MGVTEPFKKWRRSVDISLLDRTCRCLTHARPTSQPRKVIFVLLTCVAFFFYWGPSIANLFFSDVKTSEEFLNECEDDYIKHFHYNEGIIDDFVFGINKELADLEYHNKYIPIVGNGAFSVSFYPKPSLYLKDGRTLSLNSNWDPIQTVSTGGAVRGVYYTDVLKGTVSHYQCVKNGLRISSTYFAHRTNPHLFYQDISILNPTNHDLQVNFDKINLPSWSSFSSNGNGDHGLPYQDSLLTFSGVVKNISSQESVGVCVAMKGLSSSIEVPPHRTKHHTIPSIVYYENQRTEQFVNQNSAAIALQQKCINLMKDLSGSGRLKWEQDHFSSWNKLWKTGLTISQSKASGALNNDRINATVYYVLSNVATNVTHSSNLGILKPVNITSHVQLVEGCYGGYHHTLQARSLWKEFNSHKEVKDIVNLWLLTLEKQGCHKLLMTGAEGVAQAMTLSFGGFRFSPHHLEFKIEPKFLHRDYQFRNIEVGFNTHINVSVILQENNKAVLAVWIDKADRDYWACDGGCIDEPVKLSEEKSIFPVKITEPITSILYITPDRNHMELIKDTLHVHNIVEAPAHDHHVVALHRHGSHFGGLPIMFWATVITLIVIFHLFLCKLIYNEYCGKHDKGRNRYSRLPNSSRGV